MSVLTKAIYRLGASPFKIPVGFFFFLKEVEKSLLKCIWNHKSRQTAREILRNNNALPDFKLYYKAIAIKTVMYWNKVREIDQAQE